MNALRIAQRMRTPLALGLLAAGVGLAPRCSLAADDSRWPPFLPARDSVPDAALVEHVWGHETFRRTLSPPPLDVPLVLYAALIDAPDVLAAAAARRGLSTETAARRADGSYEFRSPKGSRAGYRMLLSEPDRRVVLSHGHLVVVGLKVAGSVLGVLELQNREEGLRQRLTVHARLNNTVWAFLTKFLLALMPALADEQLSRGFRIAGAIATWARHDRDEFCAWLGGSGIEAPRVAFAAGCPDEDRQRDASPWTITPPIE